MPTIDTTLELAELEAVVGGGTNETTVSTPVGSVTSKQTDYAICASEARRYCDSQPQNQGFWGTSTAKASACMKSTLPAMCGTPKK